MWKGVSCLKIEITYPPVSKRGFQRRKLVKTMRWPILLAAYTCPIVNLCVGGKAWSVIVLMALYMLWTLVLSPDLVEYNRISQPIKLIACSCVLLALIDLLLAPGWAMLVVPLVCFAGLLVSAVLFFTDLEKQKQNMLPMLLLAVMALLGAVVGLSVWHGEGRWALAVMGSFSLALLITCILILGADFTREIRRRFHTR